MTKRSYEAIIKTIIDYHMFERIDESLIKSLKRELEHYQIRYKQVYISPVRGTVEIEF